MADNGRRRRGDDALVLAIAAGQTVRRAAQTAKIGERTATRRVAEPEFRKRVADARAEMVARALGRLENGMASAGATLRKLLHASNDHVKLGAARALLELGARLRETVELDERLAAVENALPPEEDRRAS